MIIPPESIECLPKRQRKKKKPIAFFVQFTFICFQFSFVRFFVWYLFISISIRFLFNGLKNIMKLLWKYLEIVYLKTVVKNEIQ